MVYQIAYEHLKELSEIFKPIVEEQEMAQFDRAHFVNYAELSLEFEVVYYIHNSDFLLYRDVHQTVNLRIFEEFSRRGIEFAFPTRTFFLNRDTATEKEESMAGHYGNTR
ncbi:mechanosensitive ion channel family protein [Nafulsella turpanensis]|uniref:mechanosensitive ion channel family protein n=1 Tax=Nafulsella turpanensis TaxID=1265690 RepID=UPI000346810A|nr:mechanosensitive ion channel family protein [Nafulsella turpanensis]